ncbi:MAG: hypothetical protein WBP79_14500, partial [Candidatus Acidiferrales bacterium]
LWSDRLTSNWYPGQSESESKESKAHFWLLARNQVPGAGSPAGFDSADLIGITRGAGVNAFERYYNCLPDAFATAQSTLQERIAKFGAASTEVKEWLAAQDQVFANCPDHAENTATILPAVAHPEDNPLIRADRAYQIAAAYFYDENFPKSEELFEQIARDKSSPWAGRARLVLARTYIREATLGMEEGKIDADLLAKAEAQLQAITADKNAADLHPAAQRLNGFVEFRLHPRTRLLQLSENLSRQSGSADFEQDLWDYSMLLDRWWSLVVEPLNGNAASMPIENREEILSKTRASSDLTDWIFAFQEPGGTDHAVERWQQTHSLPWLVAAISQVPASHPQAAAILEAAAKISPDSPAFATVSFHRVRLQMESKQGEAARAELDILIEKQNSHFPPSSLNLLLAQRLKLARNLPEFLKCAPRGAATVSSDTQGLEIPDDNEAFEGGISDTADDYHPAPQPPRFDADAVQYFNLRLPLTLLKETASGKGLPEPLRKEVAQVAWVRAVILGDDATAQSLAPVVASLSPELKDDLQKYTAEDSQDKRAFAARIVILRNPGLRPYLTAGVARASALSEMDQYRDNWWCNPSGERTVNGAWQPRLRDAMAVIYESELAPRANQQQKIGSPAFLTGAEKAAADKEWEKLASLEAAPSYLTRAVLDWAKVHPTDERVPEALHLAVRSTRYGCTDVDSGNLSKEAFDLLHHQYPASTWTEKTKYWFGSQNR